MEFSDMFNNLYGFNSKEFSKPSYYDSETGEIHNSKEGSLVWWHEMGHKRYENHPDTSNKDYTRQSMWKCAIFFTVLALFINVIKYFAIMFLFANIYYAVSEEAWCWRYALEKYKKQEQSKPRPEVLRFLPI